MTKANYRKPERTREQEIAHQVRALLFANTSLRQVCQAVGDEFGLSWNRVYVIFKQEYPQITPKKEWDTEED